MLPRTTRTCQQIRMAPAPHQPGPLFLLGTLLRIFLGTLLGMFLGTFLDIFLGTCTLHCAEEWNGSTCSAAGGVLPSSMQQVGYIRTRDPPCAVQASGGKFRVNGFENFHVDVDQGGGGGGGVVEVECAEGVFGGGGAEDNLLL